MSPILNACGWAINSHIRMTLRLGAVLGRSDRLLTFLPPPDEERLAASLVRALGSLVDGDGRRVGGRGDLAHAVVVQAGLLFRLFGEFVARRVLGLQRTAFEEMDRLIEHAGVAGGHDVAARRERQP